MPEYAPAYQVRSIAHELISEIHQHLAGIRIEYVFKDKATVSKGKVVLGKARKLSGLNAYLAYDGDPTNLAPDEEVDFFVIEIGRDWWEHMSIDKRRALVDHELCHLLVLIDEETGMQKLALRAHDVEEFSAVVRRNGLWKEGLQHFAEVLAQTPADAEMIESRE